LRGGSWAEVGQPACQEALLTACSLISVRSSLVDGVRHPRSVGKPLDYDVSAVLGAPNRPSGLVWCSGIGKTACSSRRLWESVGAMRARRRGEIGQGSTPSQYCRSRWTERSRPPVMWHQPARSERILVVGGSVGTAERPRNDDMVRSDMHHASEGSPPSDITLNSNLFCLSPNVT